MHYDARVTREGDAFVIVFPDAPGCQTFARSEDDIVRVATEALEGWLEAHVAERRMLPDLRAHEPPAPGTRVIRIEVNEALVDDLMAVLDTL